MAEKSQPKKVESPTTAIAAVFDNLEDKLSVVNDACDPVEDQASESAPSILAEIDPDEDDREADRNRFNPYFRTW
jgi:hypothetical protein